MKSRSALAFWLLVFVGACAQLPGFGGESAPPAQPGQLERAFLPDGGPPVVDGLYDAHDACPFEGCGGRGDAYVSGDVELFDRPAIGARVVGTMPAGTWVQTRGSVLRSRPVRGVVVGEVRNAYLNNGELPVLAVGDVVYAIEYLGEGESVLWRRGDTMTWMDSFRVVDGVTDGIRWDYLSDDDRLAVHRAGGGWWLELEANGLRGWTRELDDVDCLGRIDPPDHCAERWSANPG